MPHPPLPSDERSAQLFSDFFDNAAVGLHWQARDGTIQRANQAELELLGYSAAEYVGQPIARFHDDPAVAADIVARLAAGETLNSFPARLRAKDGSLRHVLLSANVLWEGAEFVHARCFTRDISDLNQALEALAAANRRKTAILEASLDAIVTMDAEGRLVDFNAAAERIFGYEREWATGRPLAELIIPPRLRAAHHAGLARYLQTGEARVLGRRIELAGMHADGHEFPVELTIAVVGGSPPMFTATLRDISSRKAAEQERRALLESERAARAAAERLSDVKDQFLATLSHELRTPLNAILGWVQILRRRPGSPQDVMKGVETIERNARIQTRMIEELLDTSRIAAGKVRLELQPVDFADTVRAAVDAVRPSADAKGVRLALQEGAGTPVLEGDPHRLQQVVWNLLTNAVKFTPAGGQVTVQLQLAEGRAELRVHDTGEGMAPEFLQQAFERFRQADASITRRHGGLGLGLAIVRSLVELHGGSVEAHSPGQGQGSTFVVRLPLAAQLRSGPGEGQEPAAAPQHPELSGLTALVVDDDPDGLDLLQRLLEQEGVRVLAASGAAEALVLLQAQRPELVVSDIGMPDVDGYELIRRIRALPQEQGGLTPAAALTAFARPQDRQRALQAGFDAHLAKPVEAGELLACVGALRRLARQRSAAPEG